MESRESGLHALLAGCATYVRACKVYLHLRLTQKL